MKKVFFLLFFCAVFTVSCAHVKSSDKKNVEEKKTEKPAVETRTADCQEIIDKVLAKYVSCKTFRCKSSVVYKTYTVNVKNGKKENYKYNNPVDFVISFSRPDMIRADFTEIRNGKNALPDTTSSLYTKNGEFRLFYYQDALVPADKILNYRNLEELADRWSLYPYSPMYFLTRMLFGSSQYLKDGKYNCKLLESEKVNGKDCWKIEADETVTGWIDKESYAVVKIARTGSYDRMPKTRPSNEIIENVVIYTDILFDAPLSGKDFIFDGKTDVPEYEEFIVLNNKTGQTVKIVHEQGEVMLPVKTVARHLGYSFVYDKKTGTASFVKGGDKIVLTSATSAGEKNGKKFELNVPSAYAGDDIIVSADFFPKAFEKNVVITSKKAEICDDVFLDDADAKLYLKKGVIFEIRLSYEDKSIKKQWAYRPSGIKQLDRNVGVAEPEKMDIWYGSEGSNEYEKTLYTITPDEQSRVWIMEAEKPGKYVLLFVENNALSLFEEIINYSVTVTE